MIEMDYVFDVRSLRQECQGQDLLSDYTLSEREMLMRLHVDGVEVFGQAEDEYQRWMDKLESNNVSLHVPSSAWTLLSVLSIAASVDSAFYRLRKTGRSDVDSLDCVIRMTQLRGIVTVYIRTDRVGQASYKDMYATFTLFAERVRRDFLSVCPQLRNHVTLGPWFRGEDGSVDMNRSQEILYLPPGNEKESL